MGSASRSEVSLSHWWTRTVGAGPTPRSQEVLDDLLERHREPHRRYHTASHVLWVLRHADSLAGEHPVGDLAAVFAAAFFHDAIYDAAASQAGANERASAALASRCLGELGWDGERVEQVGEMIVATATHRLPGDGTGDPAGADRLATAVLLDADLAVLGADTAAYRTYASGVRTEYAHVDDEAWRTGRSAVLDTFLARDTIFVTAAGRRQWEARARANLTAELMTLRQPSG